MSKIDEIKEIKEKLNKTKTRVTHEDGISFTEERKDDGSFEILFDNKSDQQQPNLVSASNKHWGYVFDLNPDLQIASVADGVYLSSQDVAQDLDLLKKHGITHIVNVATGIQNMFPKEFSYFAINVLDCPTQNLRKHFLKTLEFMRKAVQSGGKVLVHCNAGISRSSTMAIAYIMYFDQKSFQESYDQVRANRSVARPNFGFIDQLKEFEIDIKKGLNLGI